MARPSKLTGDVRLTICDGIRLGVSFEEACRRARVAPSTGWEWRARGEGRDPRRRATTRYVLFAEAVAQAEGFLQSVEGFADAQSSEGAEMEFLEFPEPNTGFAEIERNRAKSSYEPGLAEPQNRFETGEAAGFSQFPQSGEGFAEQAKSDTQKKVLRVSRVGRARAREDESDEEPGRRAPMPWRSKSSRGRGSITRGIVEREF